MSCKVYRHTEEAKAKISRASKLWHQQNEHPLKGKGGTFAGCRHTDAAKAKISAAAKKRRLSPEHKAKIGRASRRMHQQKGSPMKGRNHSAETRAKISKGLKEAYANGSFNGNRGRRASIETRTLMSERRRGSNNGNWRGGLTTKVRDYRKSYFYQLWRRVILERDDHICQYCGKISNIVHHLLPMRQYPDYSLCLDNGITICKSCHISSHTKRVIT